MPPRKRQKLGKKTGTRAKQSKTQSGEDAEADDFFLDVGEEQPDEVEAEVDDLPENAEEKRLRLAKAYLKQLRASGVADEEENDEELILGDEELAERLRQQAQEAGGHIQRQIAERISIPGEGEVNVLGHNKHSKFYRCHDVAVTAVALTNDDSTAYSVGKDGRICKLDIETGSRSVLHEPDRRRGTDAEVQGPDWVARRPRQTGQRALLAAAISSDGHLLAVGGTTCKVHVWDTRSQQLVQSYPGHKDAITGLAFRHATHELYSASLDRSIKLWSLDDRAYVDTLFGHQAEALALDALRAERLVSAGYDRTCRVWKVPEESQLVFRAPSAATDCCRYVTGTEWVSGSADGSLALWSQLKKKPAVLIRGAHGSAGAAWSASGPEAAWVQSVAVCRGADLVASGAGDGAVRLWQASRGDGGQRGLKPLSAFPVRGFANALAVAGSGRFVVAGLGREQRLGRWAAFRGAKTGLLVQPLDLADDVL